MHTLKFSEAGVRGIVGDSLTPQLAASLASTFGKYTGGGRIIVARDTRQSGKMLEQAVVAGLLAAGCQPLLLGIAPTPTAQLTVKHHRANGGIVITASHNPVEWNALKFVGPSGTFLDARESAELFDIFTQGNLDYCAENEFKKLRYETAAFELHMRRIFREIDVEAVRRRRFRVAVDCGNGVAALYSRHFLEQLGCEAVSIHDEADGIFRRPPEPLPAHIADLCAAVKAHHCAVGFAHDPDGDRMTLVTDQGRALDPQYTLLLAVDHVLSETPGPVAVNIQTSRAVEDIAASYGCEVFYSKIGEINVVNLMLEKHSEIGGEGNCGGVIWRRLHPGRDSYAAMALVLEMLALTTETITDICASVPEYFIRSEKFPCGAFRAREIIREFNNRYQDYERITLDGLRLTLPSGWVLLRASNTEPVLRLTVEAQKNKDAQKLLDDFSAQVKKLNT
ncbi:MAG: phosphoglucosamine mutase [Victivallaceae bacterium]|nr:phosphoglucosamine mutase [Victivallaceae bacterium]